MVRLPAVVVCRALPVVAGAVVAGAGCAQLAGIDDTSGNHRPTDSVTISRVSVGSTVSPPSPLDLTGLEAEYLVSDGPGSSVTTVPAQADLAAATWTTTLHAPAPVVFTLPDVPMPIRRLFAFPVQHLSVLYSVLEHPGPAPAPDGATFAVTTPLDTPVAMGETFQNYVVGAWLRRDFSAAEVALGAAQLAPPAYGFTAANSVAGRAQPDRVTAADAFLILRYLGAGLTGVAEADPFDQMDTATAVTTPAMKAVAADRTLDVEIAPSTLATRYMAVSPKVSSLVLNWSLVAAPGYRYASNAGPALHSGSLMMTDVGLSVKYGNPFEDRGWHTIFTLATSESRVYAPAGPMGMATPITLAAGMNQFLEPSADGMVGQLDLPARLPTRILLNDLFLISDGQPVRVSGSFVQVTIELEAVTDDAAQRTLLYNLQVIDLVVNPAGTALDRHLVFSAASNEPRFSLPADVFQAGHSYTLRALTTHDGYPGIMAGDLGDFVDRDLPLTQSYLDSGVFTVMP